MHQEYTVIEGDFVNAGKASSSVKKTLKQLNVNPQVVKRVVVALYEAEVNAIAHAYGGKVLVDIEPDKIKMVVADKGPGIPDIALAMQEGYSTARPEVRDMGFGGTWVRQAGYGGGAMLCLGPDERCADAEGYAGAHHGLVQCANHKDLRHGQP